MKYTITQLISDKSELIAAVVFLVLFSMLTADVASAFRSTDIHAAVESIIRAQGGAK